FFEAIPGFFNSQLVKDLITPLPGAFRSKFVDSLGEFLRRTLLSNSVSQEAKTRRLVICVNATDDKFESSDISRILGHLHDLRLDQVPQSVDTAQMLAQLCASGDVYFAEPVRRIIAGILPCVRDRDDRWMALAVDQFGVPERVLRDNIAHGGNSVLLSILIHMAGLLRTDRRNWRLLSPLSKFDIHDTLPRLQHEFCALW